MDKSPTRRHGRRRVTLKHNDFKLNMQLGTATVVLLVALRMAVGCHFLYEGVWKIANADKFSAEPFLSQAKGPMAGLFYAMLPDIDGRQRLGTELRTEKDKDGNLVVRNDALIKRWDEIRREVVEYYRPDAEDEKAKARHQRLEKEAEETFKLYRKSAESYLTDNWEDIQAYFGSLDRFEQDELKHHKAAHQKQRRWDEMQKLRREVKGWVSELEAMEEEYKAALWGLLDENQQAKGSLPFSSCPRHLSRIGQINFAVTYGLTAIGLCLLLGLFTRPAAVGGGLFMLSVVLTQPAWPGIYPPDPPVVGHALLINKDFIEMLVLFVLATTAVGRWAGLDFFVENFVVRMWSRLRRRKAE